jgi:hypothetical protein
MQSELLTAFSRFTSFFSSVNLFINDTRSRIWDRGFEYGEFVHHKTTKIWQPMSVFTCTLDGISFFGSVDRLYREVDLYGIDGVKLNLLRDTRA